MTISSCMRADLLAGFSECWRRILLVMGIGMTVIGLWLLEAKGFGYDNLDFTLGDTLSACLGGIEVFDPERDLRFRLPSAWLLTLLSICFVTSTYPYRDLMGFGRNLLISSGSRWRWWLSKCTWVTVTALTSCLALILVCAAFSLLLGGDLSLSLGKEAADSMRIWVDSGQSRHLLGFALCWLCAVPSVCLLQLVLSLAIKPVLSFGATGLVLLMSAYYFSPLLLGNYIMVARTRSIIASGTSPLAGIALSILIAGASVVIGGTFFSKLDCMDKEYSA